MNAPVEDSMDRPPVRLVRSLCLALPAAALLCLALPRRARADDPPTTSRFFEAYDKDHDGKVTPEELGVDPEIFRVLDKNGDGVVTPEDLGPPAGFHPRRPPEGGRDAGPGRPEGMPGPGALPRPNGAPGPDGPRGPDGTTGPGGPNGPRLPEGRGPDPRLERLHALDVNGDGKVSREEFPGPDEAFQRLDRNHDGVLDEKDLLGPDGERGPDNRGAAGRDGGPGARMRERMREQLHAMDKDGDGRVSKEEYTGRIPFERLDRNGDGFLDPADAPPEGGPRGERGRGDPEARFQELDVNHDGSLDATELKRPEVLRRLDRDNDGLVSKEEFLRAAAELRGGRRGGERGARPGLSEEAFRRFDADKDGKVTREEFPGSDERFDELDTNHDGVLTDADRVPPKADAPRAFADVLTQDDVDGDGRVSRREFQGPAEAFDRLDTNSDGFLDRQDQPPAPPAPDAPPPPPHTPDDTGK